MKREMASLVLNPFDIAICDIEGDALYDGITQIHCATMICCVTEKAVDFGPNDLPRFKTALGRVKLLVGHNVIDFDGPAVEKVLGHPYARENWLDTLVLSRLLYPDMLGGHSLDAWGKRLGEQKIDWRQECIDKGYIAANAPKGEEFKLFRPEMQGYCHQDCRVNLRLLQRLMKYCGWKIEDLININRGE